MKVFFALKLTKREHVCKIIWWNSVILFNGFCGQRHDTFWTIYKKNSHSFSQFSAYEIHESLTFDEIYTKYELKG